jgi:L-threonylcarbamoyladenylate synthase
MPEGAIPSLLIRESKVLVVAPSANLSGESPACDATRVKKNFNGVIDMIIDGGKCKWGVASTVVDVTGSVPQVIREGAISKKELKHCLK